MSLQTARTQQAVDRAYSDGICPLAMVLFHLVYLFVLLMFM